MAFTYFFRDAQALDLIAEHVVPDLSTRRYMDVWDAGCATGPEPYSIAMTVPRGLRYPKAWKVEIVATDISEKALAAARRGVYEKSALRLIPRAYHDRYVRESARSFQVSDELKEMVSFHRVNLKELSPEGRVNRCRGANDGPTPCDWTERFDVIFCRNVLIYFHVEAQQRLIDSLYACLKPGGILFTGDAEPLHIYDHEFISRENDGAFYYEKPFA